MYNIQFVQASPSIQIIEKWGVKEFLFILSLWSIQTKKTLVSNINDHNTKYAFISKGTEAMSLNFNLQYYQDI